MRYMVVVEKGPTSYGAFVPDLPGCVAVAETEDDAMSLIREAIEIHLEDMAKKGQPFPMPAAKSAFVDVQMAA